MTALDNRAGKTAVTAVAALFFIACTWTSYARWANFEYRTFDLAYYVQAIWQLIHGRFQVSVEDVPLLGNHVEPIVFLFAPLFALFRHPMLFVVVQNAALAAMAPVGFNIAKRLGLDGKQAALLGIALLLAPAAGYIALHEFHPEALAAPLLLLMLQARLSHSVARHWIWFIAVLACKENMALLLCAYCAVQCFIERERGMAELRRWYLWPMGLAIVWFLLCTRVITPALNSGSIDYLALYDRLGSSPGDILGKAITQPQLIGRALFQSLTHGNLVWALLFPFLFLPLLRPRWLLIAAPVLLQHLLSWRSSEWTIYFHYAAPLLPIFWIGLVEVLAAQKFRKSFLLSKAPWLILVACLVSQLWLGPAPAIASTTTSWFARKTDRARKNDLISLDIPAQASVVAPLPYLSHLAMRERLYSLHYILKGLKTLSRTSYEPPAPTDFVLIDYLDSATFDSGAGYYHPVMKTVDGRIIPSSDQLLHDFLKQARWWVWEREELSLFERDSEPTPPRNVIADIPGSVEIGTHTKLLDINTSENIMDGHRELDITISWSFEEGREVFPWMLLRLKTEGKGSSGIWLTKGLCAPEIARGLYAESWYIPWEKLPPGDYALEAVFVDNSKRAWYEATGGSDIESTLLCPPVPLGQIKDNQIVRPR